MTPPPVVKNKQKLWEVHGHPSEENLETGHRPHGQETDQFYRRPVLTLDFSWLCSPRGAEDGDHTDGNKVSSFSKETDVTYQTNERDG